MKTLKKLGKVSAILSLFLVIGIIVAATAYISILKEGLAPVISGPKQLASTPARNITSELIPLSIAEEDIGYVLMTLKELGHEHVYTPLQIEWLDQNKRATKEIVINNDAPDVWSLGIESITPNSTGIEVKVSGTHTYSLEEKEFILLIGDKVVSGDFPGLDTK